MATYRHPLKNISRIKTVLIGLILTLINLSILHSAPLWFHPVKLTQPDNSVLNLFVSGDEFFNYIHDSLGYPVKQGNDGFYYYVLQKDTLFTVTDYRAEVTDPKEVPGIQKVSVPSNIEAKRAIFYSEMEKMEKSAGIKRDSKWSGTYSNLVIYIRFSDQDEFPSTYRGIYDERFNSLSTSSVRHYYREISDNQLDMISYHLPGDEITSVSFQDIHPRDYYRPYNASNNPTGYDGSTERRLREHQLLVRAIDYINDNYEMPEGVNFDINTDGLFDNVAFVVRGSSDGWSDLLWPHRWVLYTYNVSLWGKRVYSYTFQLQNVNMTTFAHEMFHALGAPDLYRYNNDFVPVGRWDLMASGRGHPLTWMKYQYGKWIESIPEINSSGTYTLFPVNSSAANSYKVPIPGSSSQFLILEFRKRTGLYESQLPGEGVIIYRVDTRYRGNAQGPPDELYLFHPGGTLENNGNMNLAAFSNLNGKPEFNDSTDPYPFLQNGTTVNLNIRDITHYGDSMTFTIDMDKPTNLLLTPFGDSEMGVAWSSSLENRSYLVAASKIEEELSPTPSFNYSPGDNIGTESSIVYKGTARSFYHSNLESDELYYYHVWAVLDEENGAYSAPAKGSARSGIYTIISPPYEESFSEVTSSQLPRGWKAEGGFEQWLLATTESFSPPNALAIKNNGYWARWFYTPGIRLSANSKYLISFRYRNITPGSQETLSLHGSSDRHDGSLLASNIFSDANVSYNDYIIGRTIFNSTVAGPYYFAFRTSFGKDGVLIDDFKIEKAPKETKILTKPDSFYPNPSKGKIIIPAKEETTIGIFRSDGTAVFSKVIEGTDEIDISHLGPGVYIIRFTNSGGVFSSRLILLPY